MKNRALRTTALACAGALLVLIGSPWHARAQVPGQVDFQGLLLDSAGDPVNGLVDLDFALFDVDTGGTPLWSESHADVSVVDGVYDVALGSVTPLTPALLATGTVYLEITVEGETLAPRRALLAVPYAVRAAEAESLDGFSGAYFSQIIEHVEFDGAGPPNTDPREGLGDADGDGVANFLDPDNDADGLSDAEEVAMGSDMNVVTPRITGFAPPSAAAAFPANVTVQGTSFQAGMTVSFGAENPTPSNVTPTSFDVSIASAPVGSSPVMVTLPNGESASTSYPRTASLAITGFSPPSLPADAIGATVTVLGAGFAPGLVVDAFGSETPTPMNLTPTSFEVQVGPQAGGVASVMVSIPNGETATLGSAFEFRPNRRVIIGGLTTGAIGGLAGADALCAAAAANQGLASIPFLPWLADSTDSPATRFFQSTIPYLRFDGLAIADDWADLVDGTLDQPIVGLVAWANVALPSATGAGTSCLDWTSASGAETGRTGNGTSTTQWTNNANGTCDFPRVLYCFEQ